MDEARRFLRYILPGTVFAIETPLLVLLLRPDLMPIALSALKGSDLGVALAGVLATGGLGFLFSVFHHAIRWRPGGTMINHQPNLNRLAEVLNIQGAEPGNLSREDAWVITSTLWYTRRKSNRLIEGADDNARALIDIAHMLGASRVAVVFSALTAFLISILTSAPSVSLEAIVRFLAAAAIAIVLFRLFQSSYERAERFALKVIDNVLADALHLEHAPTEGSALKGPITTHPLLGPPEPKSIQPPPQK